MAVAGGRPARQRRTAIDPGIYRANAGVRRTSVTVVARTLQEAGMIRYKRGHINLIDVPALQETACECYHTVKMNYDALLHASNR
jgi:hypothetical protein